MPHRKLFRLAFSKLWKSIKIYLRITFRISRRHFSIEWFDLMQNNLKLGFRWTQCLENLGKISLMYGNSFKMRRVLHQAYIVILSMTEKEARFILKEISWKCLVETLSFKTSDLKKYLNELQKNYDHLIFENASLIQKYFLKILKESMLIFKTDKRLLKIEIETNILNPISAYLIFWN